MVQSRSQILENFRNGLRNLISKPRIDNDDEAEFSKRKAALPSSVDETVISYVRTRTWTCWVSFFLATVLHLGVSKKLVKLDYDKVLHLFCREYPNADLVDAVTVLCQHGANPNYLNSHSENALFAFMKNDKFWRLNAGLVAAVVSVLVAHQLDVNQLNWRLENALWPLLNQALIHCFCSVATILVTAGISVTHCPPGERDTNALLAFIGRRGGSLFGERSRLRRLVELFVDRGGLDVNATNHDGDNLLTVSARHPYLVPDCDTVRFLIDRGLDVRHRNCYRDNVLHVVCLSSRHKNLADVARMVEQLVEAGIDAAETDDVEHTALLNLLMTIDELDDDALKLINLLIVSSSKSELKRRPKSIDDLCSFLEDRNDLCLAKMYSLARHVLSATPSSGDETHKNNLLWPLVCRLTKNKCCDSRCPEVANESTSLAFVKLLMDYGVDPDVELIAKRETALAHLCECYHGASLAELIELLLENGANPNFVLSRGGGQLVGVIDLLLANRVQGREFRQSPERFLAILVQHGFYRFEGEYRDIALRLVVQQKGFKNVYDLVESRCCYSNARPKRLSTANQNVRNNNFRGYVCDV